MRGPVSVRHALLALLSEGPKYGLQLREEFEARTGEVWPLNVGQVYTTLQRLEGDGLGEADRTRGGGPPQGFRLTAVRALPAPGRSGHQGARGGAAARCRRARRDPGAPPVPGAADAAVDPD